jgi:predicted Zn-dependent peptidase
MRTPSRTWVAAAALGLGMLSTLPAAAQGQPAKPQPAKPDPAKPQPAKPQPAAAAAVPDAPVRVPLVFEKFVLPNGLEVILHEDKRTPIVAVNVWYHVGSKDEAPGKNGFAHLFEHVMFQGSRNVGEDMFFKYLESAGASDRNGSTNNDRTNYYETVPSNQLELALWLESDRMGYLLEHANQETFVSQREVVKNERRQNYENAPYGLVRQFVREAIFPANHPYHLLTIGSPEDLDAATFEDVRAFFRSFYVPNNATLVVAGAIDKAQAKALVQKYFATLPKGGAPPLKKGPMPVTLAKETRLQVEADVELARVQLSWPTPPHYAPGDGELDVLAGVLTTGKSSRLYKRLVYDMQIAQDVGAGQASSQLASQFDIVVTLKKGKSPADALKVVDEELARLRAAPPAAPELERAKAKILSGMVFAMERVGTRADQINQYNQLAGDPGYFDKDVARYEKTTAADVQRAAQTWLPADKRIVTVVTPTAGAPRAGRLATGAPAAAATPAAAAAKPAAATPAAATPAAPLPGKPAAAPAKPAGGAK